ncbi:unnamed protein product [Rotaria magnacalcarata]|uniref:Uncharacterized protein n=1 Tax=Rotaria magnacalcarata TaxID=392030 RepID=A0A816RIX0_9BILA|nr:unnamed protein product [Rotaria magnacalcarata]
MEGNQIGENFTAIPNEPSVPNNNEPESPPPPYDQVTQQRPNRQSNRRNENVTQQPDISDKLEYAPASKTKRKVMKVHHEAGVEIIGGTGAVYGTGAAPTIIMNRIQSMIVVAYAMILSLYVT